jgi:hypothetical protein
VCVALLCLKLLLTNMYHGDPGRKLAMHELRIMIALTTLSFKMLPLPEELDNMNVIETMLRKPRDCYAKFEVLQGW